MLNTQKAIKVGLDFRKLDTIMLCSDPKKILSYFN